MKFYRQHPPKPSPTMASPWGRPPPQASFFPSDVLALSKLVTRGRLGAAALFYESSTRCCFASLNFNTQSATLLSTFAAGVTVSGLLFAVFLRSEGLYPARESFG